jgi:hypothetical protein
LWLQKYPVFYTRFACSQLCGPDWERPALFDENGNAVPALKEFRRVAYYPESMPAAFGGPKYLEKLRGDSGKTGIVHAFHKPAQCGKVSGMWYCNRLHSSF